MDPAVLNIAPDLRAKCQRLLSTPTQTTGEQCQRRCFQSLVRIGELPHPELLELGVPRPGVGRLIELMFVYFLEAGSTQNVLVLIGRADLSSDLSRRLHDATLPGIASAFITQGVVIATHWQL